MSHYSKGADRNGVLQLDLVVRGTVPEFPETQIVNVKPYWEEYLQTGEGNYQYFFGDKMEFFFFQNNLKNLDPSYKMDLDLWDCLGRVRVGRKTLRI